VLVDEPLHAVAEIGFALGQREVHHPSPWHRSFRLEYAIPDFR
jgi:hypothetical protein